MTDSNGPLRRAWTGAWLVLGACFALWLAVQLISAVWLWLVVGGAVVAATYLLVSWLRWRQRRW